MIKIKFKEIKVKYKITALVFFFLALATVFLYWLDFGRNGRVDYGVTFSKIYAEELGLDWKEAYLAVINDLNPKSLRLIAYWNQIEQERGEYDFQDLDWQVEESRKRSIDVVIVVGRRVPRWPECHEPDWLISLTKDEQQKETLGFIRQTVERYRPKSHVIAWQVENEPLFSLFGECPQPDQPFLKAEAELVRKLDPLRPIIITDSGELSSWLKAPRYADVLGTTLYRVVWNNRLGYFKHIYPASYYYFKSRIIKKIFSLDEIIVSELQAEPWPPGGLFISEISLEEQFKSMDLDQFKKNMDFAKKAGFKKAYLWGAEWWYWLKVNHGNSDFWEEAKRRIQNKY